MKTMKFFFASVFALALTFGAQAQMCDNALFPFVEGMTAEYHHFNPKGKLTASHQQQVGNVQTIDGGFSADILFTYNDKKGNETYSGDYGLQCTGDQITMDVESMLSGMDESFRNMNMTVDLDGTGLSFPATLSVGQELPDGNVSMKASMNGMQMMSAATRIVNRKVQSQEDITVPAGTFTAYKITYTTEIENRFITTQTEHTDWLVAGTGMVRQETRKDGKLESYTELVSLKK